jgi:hypothetical protein
VEEAAAAVVAAEEVAVEPEARVPPAVAEAPDAEPGAAVAAASAPAWRAAHEPSGALSSRSTGGGRDLRAAARTRSSFPALAAARCRLAQTRIRS